MSVSNEKGSISEISRNCLRVILLVFLTCAVCLGLSSCSEPTPSSEPVEIASEDADAEESAEETESTEASDSSYGGDDGGSYESDSDSSSSGSYSGSDDSYDYGESSDSSSYPEVSSIGRYNFFAEPSYYIADDEYCAIYFRGVGFDENGWLCIVTEVTNNHYNTIHFFPTEPWCLDRISYEPYGCDGGMGTIEPGETKECCISFNPDDGLPDTNLQIIEGLTNVYDCVTNECLGEYWIMHWLYE